MLGERSYTLRLHNVTLILTKWHSGKGKIVGIENRLLVARGWGLG